LRSKFEKVFREMNVKKWLFRKAWRIGFRLKAKIYWINIVGLQRMTSRKRPIYLLIF